MKRLIMHTFMLFGMAVLLLTCTVRASEYESGTVQVRLPKLGTAMEQVGIAVYQVGESKNSDNPQEYTLAPEFSGAGVNLMGLDTAAKVREASEKLAQAIESRGLSGKRGLTNAEGTVTFAGLAPGMYLIMQISGEDSYGTIQPVLTFLPYTGENGVLMYDTEADVKAEPPVPTSTPKPTARPTWTPTKAPRATVTPVGKTKGNSGGSGTGTASTAKYTGSKQKKATKTADNTPILAWTLLLAAAGGTAAYAGIRRKKTK